MYRASKERIESFYAQTKKESHTLPRKTRFGYEEEDYCVDVFLRRTSFSSGHANGRYLPKNQD